jgi:hypothetical protein
MDKDQMFSYDNAMGSYLIEARIRGCIPLREHTAFIDKRRLMKKHLSGCD